MNNKKQLIVESVDTDGVCYEYGIEKGDIIVSFDGKEVVDMLDYSYYDSMDSFTMTVKRGNEFFDCQIEKDETEELGLNFEDKCYLTPIPCRNKCLFCFVDQLPKGLRSSLYIKDDDYRLSFVSGNYVTLTNVSDEEINRIIERKFSPIYISVHATDDTIRMKLLGNNSAKPIMPILKKFADNGIEMHTQVVMCMGLNDGHVLKKTISDLWTLYPMVRSLAVVPVGMTDHRNGLYPIPPVSQQCALDTIHICENFNNKIHKICGENFVFCSDEMYLKAEKDYPKADYYGSFEQIENGVGLLSQFEDEFMSALKCALKAKKDKFTIYTGESAYEFMSKMIFLAKSKFPQLNADVIKVENQFFGSSVTVTGLLTGKDLMNKINNTENPGTILLPRVMLREFESVFLDGMTVDELIEKTKQKIEIINTDGEALADAILVMNGER